MSEKSLAEKTIKRLSENVNCAVERKASLRSTLGRSAPFPGNTALIGFPTSLYPVPAWHWVS